MKLGVWLSNTKSRREKLTVEQRAALAALGMEWAGVVPAAEAAPAAPADAGGPGRSGGCGSTTRSVTSGSAGGRAAAGTSAALRQALAAHGLPRHRVHQFGAVLVTVTLDAPEV
ncbi:helicase associated domain-containing protein [Streptomyces roseolus]|uniref:helicase associated domain-containing protein n=1 Tax=Streptomyces roseolus TaxID=67358 RepID=UPI00378F01D8